MINFFSSLNSVPYHRLYIDVYLPFPNFFALYFNYIFAMKTKKSKSGAVETNLLGCSPMWAQNAKQKTNSQSQNTFEKKEIYSFYVVSCSFQKLHFAPAWDGSDDTQSLKLRFAFTKCFTNASSYFSAKRYWWFYFVYLQGTYIPRNASKQDACF